MSDRQKQINAVVDVLLAKGLLKPKFLDGQEVLIKVGTDAQCDAALEEAGISVGVLRNKPRVRQLGVGKSRLKVSK